MWFCTCTLILDGIIIYDSSFGPIYNPVPFTFLPLGAVAAGDVFGILTMFLGPLLFMLVLFNMLTFLVCLSSVPPTPFSFSSLSSLPSHLCWRLAARYRKSVLQYETTIPTSQESYKWWTKSRCSLRIHLCASRMLLLFPSCDTSLSEVHLTWELRVADQWWE